MLINDSLSVKQIELSVPQNYPSRMSKRAKFIEAVGTSCFFLKKSMTFSAPGTIFFTLGFFLLTTLLPISMKFSSSYGLSGSSSSSTTPSCFNWEAAMSLSNWTASDRIRELQQGWQMMYISKFMASIFMSSSLLSFTFSASDFSSWSESF